MSNVIEKALRSTVTKGIDSISEFNRKRRSSLAKPHPYLTGIHVPMTTEETLVDLVVDGEIPNQLDGRYLRIGPNPVTAPDPASYHWFIGDGMAHGIRILDGQAVWYRNRWIRSTAVSEALGEEPKPGSRNPRFDTANTNIIGVNGRTFAIVEAGGKPVELTNELETIAHNPFDGTLKHSFSAHPHLDVKTGEQHAICYDGETVDKVWHVVLDPTGQVIREEPITVSDGPSIHDCAITKNYVLIFDLPVTFSMKALLSGQFFPYAWNDKHQARVGLLPRNGTNADVVWCDVEPNYVFHVANAFETADGNVVVDVVSHDRMFARSSLGPDSMRSRLERWTINASARQVGRRVLHDHNQEFPRIDDRRTGTPYRYAYAIALPMEDHIELTIAATQLFKHDVEDASTQVRDFGKDRHPGEFVFVPRSGSGAEDDGWLIGLVVNMRNETTALEIINADDFTGPAQAVIHIPHRIPPGFHGNWVATA
ncbi:MAG: carotenoid oxygenase family protein [Proteobacteria bacterium]|nr:carotenoid oxygenase family protein [Pseudomonadota bacterium]